MNWDQTIVSSKKAQHERNSKKIKQDIPRKLNLDIPGWLEPRNRTLESLRQHTITYLEKEDVQTWIKECAEILVKGRRERVQKDPDRWEKACFGAWYQCLIKGCPRGEKKYPQRKDLKRHFLDKHRDIVEEIDAHLDKCKFKIHWNLAKDKPLHGSYQQFVIGVSFDTVTYGDIFVFIDRRFTYAHIILASQLEQFLVRGKLPVRDKKESAQAVRYSE